MSIDSRNRRASVLGYSGGDSSLSLPLADGEIDSEDRRQVTGLYAGNSIAYVSSLPAGSLTNAAPRTTTAILPPSPALVTLPGR